MSINLSKREKVLVLLAFTAVLFFLYHRYYLTPILDEAAVIKEEMRKGQERFTNLITGDSDIGILKEEMEELKSDLGMETAVPPGPKTYDIITQIENCSKAAGVVLGRMDFLEIMASQGRPGEDKQGEHYTKVPVQVHISGSYGGIMAFIKALEDSQRLYSITGFDLYNAGQENGHVLNMDIDLCAYALPMGEQPVQYPSAYELTEHQYLRENPFAPAAE